MMAMVRPQSLQSWVLAGEMGAGEAVASGAVDMAGVSGRRWRVWSGRREGARVWVVVGVILGRWRGRKARFTCDLGGN